MGTHPWWFLRGFLRPSRSVAQAVLDLAILLLPPPKGWVTVSRCEGGLCDITLTLPSDPHEASLHTPVALPGINVTDTPIQCLFEPLGDITG